MSVCRTPKMTDVVGQAVQKRIQSQREVPVVETRPTEVQNTDVVEDDVEGEESCYNKVAPNSNRQLDMSSHQQRDVAVLMGDTPSPAPSVISIRSELTDEGEDEDPQRCHMSK